jgi:DivIVA domain-containing protein
MEGGRWLAWIGMEITPKVLRDVEFRDNRKGYHPEDVDEFLEQVAVGVEQMQDRIRQLTERLQRAEAAAAESSTSDETMRKTLVLAQRTADMAVQEAQEQAARILAGAEQKAQAVLADAEAQGRGAYEGALDSGRAQLAALEEERQRAQAQVDTLTQWHEQHRGRLIAALDEARNLVDGVGPSSPPPQSRPFVAESPEQPERVASPGANGSTAEAVGGEAVRGDASGGEAAGERDQRPERADVRPGRPGDLQLPPPVGVPEAGVRADEPTMAVDERAMNEFFENNDEERRGGRFRK